MPASYSLRIKRTAEKELRRIPKADLRRIVERMERLATEPRPPSCEKLFGDNGYRVRQGDYRILYAADDGEGAIEVIEIGHRRRSIADASIALRSNPGGRRAAIG